MHKPSNPYLDPLRYEPLSKISGNKKTIDWTVIMVLVFLIFMWAFFMYGVFFAPAIPDSSPPRILSDGEKIRVERLLQKHGLVGQISVIEIHRDGTKWFEREGRLCQLK